MTFAGSFEAIAARYGEDVVLRRAGQEGGRGRAVLRPVTDRQAQWTPTPLGQQRWEKALCLAQAALPFADQAQEQTVQAGQAVYTVESVRPVTVGTERICWRALLARREEDGR